MRKYLDVFSTRRLAVLLVFRLNVSFSGTVTTRRGNRDNVAFRVHCTDIR